MRYHRALRFSKIEMFSTHYLSIQKVVLEKWKDRLLTNSNIPPATEQDQIELRSAEFAQEWWPDVKVFGNLDKKEAKTVLDSKMVALAAPSFRTLGEKWEHITSTVGELLDEVLAVHPVEAEKHGRSTVFSDSTLSGKISTNNGHNKKFAYRLKAKITAISAVTIDIDGTDKVEKIRDNLISLDLFSVNYTTHSHAAKSTPDGDRFRIVVFLEEPFPFPDESDQNRRVKVAEWEARYTGFAEALGLTDIDAAGMRLCQIMHPPRRPSLDSEYKLL